MKNLTLKDLHNPMQITSFLHKNGDHICSSGEYKTAFQAYYRQKDALGNPRLSSIELWQELPDGRLLFVQAWKGSSVICTYKTPTK